jgi:hypothetical protein
MCPPASASGATRGCLSSTGAHNPIRVQRRVSSRGQTQVCGQRIHVGLPHPAKIVTLEIADDRFNIYDQHETMLCMVPRTTTKEGPPVTRPTATRP